MKNTKNGSVLVWMMLASILLVMGSCSSSKPAQKNYKDYRYKTTQFDQKKYKIRKNYPPVQRYYTKSSLFRPKK